MKEFIYRKLFGKKVVYEAAGIGEFTTRVKPAKMKDSYTWECILQNQHHAKEIQVLTEGSNFKPLESSLESIRAILSDDKLNEKIGLLDLDLDEDYKKKHEGGNYSLISIFYYERNEYELEFQTSEDQDYLSVFATWDNGELKELSWA